MTKVDVKGPDKHGDYRIYELHTGSRLEIYRGPNPMHHILMLMRDVEGGNSDTEK